MARNEAQVILHLDQNADALVEILQAAVELYDLVPDYVTERDELYERMEQGANRLKLVVKRNASNEPEVGFVFGDDDIHWIS